MVHHTKQILSLFTAGIFIVGAGFAGMANGASGNAPISSARQKAPAQKATQKITRANLAKSASFKVTQTIAPVGSKPLVRTFVVEVKGEKARMDYDDPALGPVRYVANSKGVFFYMPGNETAIKQEYQGGVEGALRVAFAQANERLAKAKKVGKATVSGQPTVIYKDPETGTLVYLGTKKGFELPVKTELKNEGGKNTVLVTDIKLNVAIPDTRFALPAGTQIIDSKDSPGVGLPIGP
ncbi:MAG: hypothetical protein OHK0029_43260 [Armatimonadaceae bacterium]